MFIVKGGWLVGFEIVGLVVLFVLIVGVFFDFLSFFNKVVLVIELWLIFILLGVDLDFGNGGSGVGVILFLLLEFLN